MPKDVVTHESPVWRSKANFIFMVDLESHGMSESLEQLWGRKGRGDSVKLCCLPFFVYGVALGDEVKLDADSMMQGVVRKSGHRLLRVVTPTDAPTEEIHVSIHDKLVVLDLLHEWWAPGFVAVDIPARFDATDLLKFLDGLNLRYQVEFEWDDSLQVWSEEG